jgi:FYVE zinc finger
MSRSESSTSLSESLEEGESPQRDHKDHMDHGKRTDRRDHMDHRRGLSSYSSHTYSQTPQDDSQQGRRSRRHSTDQTGPPEEAAPTISPSRGSHSTVVKVQKLPDSAQIRPTTSSLHEDGPQTAPDSQSNPNMDRKRRLTNSVHNSGRVRSINGGYHSRNQSSINSQPDGLSAAELFQAQRYDSTMHGSVRASPAERALPALPPARRPSSNVRHGGSKTREFRLPKWQPDSEVSECPICSRPFTFWFRKHHCRKCGRVVCASCSPHRITIPRQFIVHPPESTYPTSTIPQTDPVVIDLTGDDPTPSHAAMPPPSWPSPRRLSNSGLGGGEEVRLCNPCVPDPQPSPPATMDLAEFLRQGPRRSEDRRRLEQPLLSRSLHVDSDQSSLYQHLPLSEARELRRQRGRGMIVCVKSREQLHD